MFELKNPIPSSYTDPKKIQNFFVDVEGKRRLLIPYYGTNDATSHNYLKTVNQLCEKSPSYRAAEKQILDFAFGLNPTVVPRVLPGMEDEELPEVMPNDKREFLLWLKSVGLGVVNLRKITRVLCKHRERSGNFFLRVILAKEDNEYYVKLDPLHFYLVAYLDTKPGEQKYVAVTPYWDADYLNSTNQKLTVYPVSLQDEALSWKVKKGGDIMETVIHVGDFGDDENTVYGRSRINAIVDNMGSECARIDHKVKVNYTALTSTNLLFFQKQAATERARVNAKTNTTKDGKGNIKEEEDSFTVNIRTLRKTISSEGNRDEVRALGAMEYPHGTDAPTLHKLEVRQDYQWEKTTAEDDEKQIYTVVGASRELSGNQQTKSGIGSEALINRYIMLNEGSIEPKQQDYDSFWNWLIGSLAEEMGETKFEELGVKFPDKIGKIVSKLRETIQAKDKAAKEEEIEEEE